MKIKEQKGNIYRMELHNIMSITLEDVKLGEKYPAKVVRVPGGWIYTIFAVGENKGNSTFVEYDNGFYYDSIEEETK